LLFNFVASFSFGNIYYPINIYIKSLLISSYSYYYIYGNKYLLNGTILLTNSINLGLLNLLHILVYSNYSFYIYGNSLSIKYVKALF